MNTIQRCLKALSHSTPTILSSGSRPELLHVLVFGHFPWFSRFLLMQPHRNQPQEQRKTVGLGKYMDSCKHNHKLRMMDGPATAIRTSYAFGHIGATRAGQVESTSPHFNHLTTECLPRLQLLLFATADIRGSVRPDLFASIREQPLEQLDQVLVQICVTPSSRGRLRQPSR